MLVIPTVRSSLQQLIVTAFDGLRSQGIVDADLAMPDFVVERTRSRAHGDFACNLAMALARTARRKPRDLATALVEALPSSPMVERVEIAGPGFINFYLTPAAWHAEIGRILEEGSAYGTHDIGHGQTVGIEFVSANPTGPLHVGHGRAAVIGDCLARLLEATGWDVRREFYYNDAGVQIHNLALSVQARTRGIVPGDSGWPEAGYRGDYIAEIAQAFRDRDTVLSDGTEVVANGDVDDLENIRAFAVAWLRREQDADLKAYDVAFDVYFLESSLYREHKVEETVTRLVEGGFTHEQDGALWLETTRFGDDKDRVMRKSDGTYTYFVPDVAYHLSKWQRGYVRAITELGADHHGSLTRVRAGLQALDCGIPEGWPEYILHQMVTVVRGGEEVKISKRAGGYVTLRDLIDEVGRDATRYFLIARKADSQLTFDIDLARSQSADNPVYYIQYAHARICSVERQCADKGLAFDATAGVGHLGRIDSEQGQALLFELSRYPEIVAAASIALEPHLLANWLRELAQAFHAFYNSHQFLVEDQTLRNARLTLAAATRQVLENGLGLLGLSAPEHM